MKRTSEMEVRQVMERSKSIIATVLAHRDTKEVGKRRWRRRDTGRHPPHATDSGGKKEGT